MYVIRVCDLSKRKHSWIIILPFIFFYKAYEESLKKKQAIKCPVCIIVSDKLNFIVFSFVSFYIGAHRAIAVEQQLSTTSTGQEHIITSVPMQSVIIPCKAVLPHIEPERVSNKKKVI
jgi:hypothetical protein